MVEIKRRPGRPPKVREPETLPRFRQDHVTAPAETDEAQTHVDRAQTHVDQAQAHVDEAMKPGGRLVEVELVRNYAPEAIWDDDAGEMIPQGEITKKLPAGTTTKLPKPEATRALRLGIARVTDNSF